MFAGAESIPALAPVAELARIATIPVGIAPFSAPSRRHSVTVKSPRANLTATAAFESYLGLVEQAF